MRNSLFFSFKVLQVGDRRERLRSFLARDAVASDFASAAAAEAARGADATVGAGPAALAAATKQVVHTPARTALIEARATMAKFSFQRCVLHVRSAFCLSLCLSLSVCLALSMSLSLNVSMSLSFYVSLSSPSLFASSLSLARSFLLLLLCRISSL